MYVLSMYQDNELREQPIPTGEPKISELGPSKEHEFPKDSSLQQLDTILDELANSYSENPSADQKEIQYQTYILDRLRHILRQDARDREFLDSYNDRNRKPSDPIAVFTFGGSENFLDQILQKIGVENVDQVFDQWDQIVKSRLEPFLVDTKLEGIKIKCGRGNPFVHVPHTYKDGQIYNSGGLRRSNTEIPHLTVMVGQDLAEKIKNAGKNPDSLELQKLPPFDIRRPGAQLALKYGRDFRLVKTL